jgi:hypothetical protein
MSTITALPAPPTTADSAEVFDAKASTFVQALTPFVTETNIVAAEVLANATTASNAATSATATVGATQWVAATNYATGVTVWSPISLFTYRRKTPGGVQATDPANDSTSTYWQKLQFTLNPDGSVPITSGGTGAITASAARTALGATTTGDAVFVATTAAVAVTALGGTATGAAVFVATTAAVARTAISAPSIVESQNSTAQILSSVVGTNAITAVLTPAITAYVVGQTFRFVAAGANTGATTININGIGVKSITKRGASPLVLNDISAAAMVQVTYDGTQFQLDSDPPDLTPYAKFAVAQSFTAAQRGAVSALTYGATITPDFAVANNFSLALTGNATLANPTNLVAGQGGVIVLTQDATGARTMAFGGYWKFPGGSAPTLTATASAVDVLAYQVESSTRITARLIADTK